MSTDIACFSCLSPSFSWHKRCARTNKAGKAARHLILVILACDAFALFDDFCNQLKPPFIVFPRKSPGSQSGSASLLFSSDETSKRTAETESTSARVGARTVTRKYAAPSPWRDSRTSAGGRSHLSRIDR